MQKNYLTEGVNDPGIFKAVFLAGGPGSGKDFVMNKLLKGYGLVEINSDVAFEALMKREGLDPKMPRHETEKRNHVRSIAKGATREKERLALAGRLGLIINGTGDDPEKYASMKAQLEHLGYDTAMVFVNTNDEVSKQRNIERGQRGGREVPEEIRKEKWDSAQAHVKRYQQIFGNDFSNVDNSTDIRHADPQTKKEIEQNFLNMYKMMRSFASKPPTKEGAIKWMKSAASKNNVSKVEKLASNKFTAGPDAETEKFNKAYPKKGEAGIVTDENVMQQARALGLSYFGFGRFGRAINGKNTVTHVIGSDHRLHLKTAAMDKKAASIKEEYLPESNMIREWANKETTQNRFIVKYGTLAEEKLIYEAHRLNESLVNFNKQQKKFKDFR